VARVLKEPLVHFALLAVAIFAWFSQVSDPQAEATDATIIAYDDFDLSQLATRYRAQWNRPPTVDDLQAILDAEVQAELLVREALALGMDRGDAVIRGRLVQKMHFLIASAAKGIVPEDDVLMQHMEDNRDRFETARRLTFDQVYLGPQLPEDGAKPLLASLQGGAAHEVAGVASLLPDTMSLTRVQNIDKVFGSGFSAALNQLEKGAWSEPVQSAFGWHLVRVRDVSPSELPPLATVRDKVLYDWQSVQTRILTNMQVDQMRARYDLRLPDEAELRRIIDGLSE